MSLLNCLTLIMMIQLHHANSCSKKPPPSQPNSVVSWFETPSDISKDSDYTRHLQEYHPYYSTTPASITTTSDPDFPQPYHKRGLCGLYAQPIFCLGKHRLECKKIISLICGGYLNKTNKQAEANL